MMLYKARFMQAIYANHATSVSELKKNPTSIIEEAQGEPIAILNHNVATANLDPTETFERLLDALDDKLLEDLALKRLKRNKKSIPVDLDDL